MTGVYDWAGQVGDTWAAEWTRTDLTFAGLAPSLDAAILAAAPNSGTAVDIGCGAGVTSITLATARPDLDVIGVDVSPQLVATAAERGAGIDNLRFEAGDAATLVLRDVDLFFSRHGVMFFDDPVAAFSAFRAAATLDGAMVFSCFRPVGLNSWATETVAAMDAPLPPPPPPGSEPPPGPFVFADPARVERILAASGWRGEPQTVDFTYRAGEGAHALDEAVALFSRIGPTSLHLASLDDGARTIASDKLRAFLASRARDGAIDFAAAAWIWTCRPVASQGAAA